MSGTRWSLQSPGGVGAVAVISLIAADEPGLDQTLQMLGVGALKVGRIALRDLLGVDQGVVMRWSATAAALLLQSYLDSLAPA